MGKDEIGREIHRNTLEEQIPWDKLVYSEGINLANTTTDMLHVIGREPAGRKSAEGKPHALYGSRDIEIL